MIIQHGNMQKQERQDTSSGFESLIFLHFYRFWKDHDLNTFLSSTPWLKSTFLYLSSMGREETAVEGHFSRFIGITVYVNIFTLSLSLCLLLIPPFSPIPQTLRFFFDNYGIDCVCGKVHLADSMTRTDWASFGFHKCAAKQGNILEVEPSTVRC